MCEQASLRDSEVQAPCADIVAGRRAEIAQMKDMLEE